MFIQKLFVTLFLFSILEGCSTAVKSEHGTPDSDQSFGIYEKKNGKNMDRAVWFLSDSMISGTYEDSAKELMTKSCGKKKPKELRRAKDRHPKANKETEETHIFYKCE